MTTLILLLIFPMLWPIAAKLIWKQELTLGELSANLAIGVLIVSAGWYMGRFVEMADVEIFNGSVISKRSEVTSCEHSYACHCTKDKCSTCYLHDHDIDWQLRTTFGDIKINRVDGQGKDEPPRYSLAQIGDPVAQSHMYSSYVRAAPDSLFNTLSDKQALAKFPGRIPRYPSRVYDYQYLDRVLTEGVNVPDIHVWNTDLARRLRKLGPTKHVNIVLLIVSEPSEEYAEALRDAWLGGKENDVVVVLGAPNYPAVSWARVISWTDNEVFKVQLRDALVDLKTIDRKPVLDTIESHISTGFVPKPMKDFSYLAYSIVPPTWVVALLALLSSIASVWVSVVFSKNDNRC
jgi:hypothetical protein